MLPSLTALLISSLSPTALLVASQFLLYAMGWVLCGALLREQRSAVNHWAGFMVVFSVGFLLAAQRSDPPTWWAYCGSALAFVTGYVLLRRGLQIFFGTVGRDRENLLILGVVAIGLTVLGPEADRAGARIALAQGACALILLRLVFDTLPAVQAEYGRRVAWVLAAPPLLRGVGFVVHALQQPWTSGAPVDLLNVMQDQGEVILSYLGGAALFNFGFTALLTLRLVRRLQDQSQRDALTGVFNRRALDQDLRREWQRWRRGGASFAVLSLDLDHFKEVNDTHGHPAGDRVLVQSAQRLVAQVREIDTLARTGGEEFVLLMPQTDVVGARAAAERLRAAIGDAPFDLAEARKAVTVSLGVIVVGAQDADFTQLLQRADKALYLAKAAGRNRAVCESG